MEYTGPMIEFKSDSEAREYFIETLNAVAIFGSLVLTTIILFLF